MPQLFFYLATDTYTNGQTGNLMQFRGVHQTPWAHPAIKWDHQALECACHQISAYCSRIVIMKYCIKNQTKLLINQYGKDKLEVNLVNQAL